MNFKILNNILTVHKFELVNMENINYLSVANCLCKLIKDKMSFDEEQQASNKEEQIAEELYNCLEEIIQSFDFVEEHDNHEGKK